MQRHVYTISATCAAFGIRHAVICPGSRSAPLVFAFSTDKRFQCHSVIDERSAAYMALGMAQQLREPVLLICTSGTAALNFFPAIAEAWYQRIPLIVLTADRPPELLNQQDGQMIMQAGVYGRHVAGSYEMPCYREGKEDSKACAQLTGKALGQALKESRPVHINIPLQDPLYPEKKKLPVRAVDAAYPEEAFPNRNYSTKSLLRAWMQSRKRMILVGMMPPDTMLFSQLKKLAEASDTVILADVLSNQQLLCDAPHFDFTLLNNPSLPEIFEPDLIISFGGPLLSKSLKSWLKRQQPAHHFRIDPSDLRIDTYGNVTTFIRAKAEDILGVLADHTEKRSEQQASYRVSWQKADAVAKAAVARFLKRGTFSELQAVQELLDQMPEAINLQVANSSAIRYVSYAGDLKGSWVLNGNRGTSGIDGCVSTAVGAAMVNNRLTVLLTGDLAFLYDKNAFWNNVVPPGLRIVVLNNNGGGIFTLIDGPSRHPAHLKYFTTPQHGSIKNAAIDNGLDHYFCDSLNGLKRHLKTFFEPSESARVLEIRTDMVKNAAAFKAFRNLRSI